MHLDSELKIPQIRTIEFGEFLWRYRFTRNSTVEYSGRGERYLCGMSFKKFSTAVPCVHGILRQCKIRKKDFRSIFKRFGYVQIAAFVRRIANQERFFGSINDLHEEKSDSKIFEYSLKLKNTEGNVDCLKNDYAGHGGAASSFYHYRFQMRTEGAVCRKFAEAQSTRVLFRGLSHYMDPERLDLSGSEDTIAGIESASAWKFSPEMLPGLMQLHEISST
jgi:hypothetical protein